nr:hypothetical protein B0A51_04834 [Rachicladosporium sp. CCFEE 5018]
MRAAWPAVALAAGGAAAQGITHTVYTTTTVSVAACPAPSTFATAVSSSHTPTTSNSTESSASTTKSATSTASSSSAAASASSTGSLTNAQQVGNSTWGTLSQPTFPKWLDAPNGTKYQTAPWGSNTVKNSDATVIGDVPVTNVTRHYDFTISRSQISVDGVLRDTILVNDQFPGPAIEANWGDWIEVVVHNNITAPEEGTALHWHGMLQRGTPWADGTPGDAQCPIAPGKSYTYRYQAELYGTSWYHAHYSAQYTGGVAGPMQIYGPSSQDYDVDLGAVMLTDWNHVPYFSIVTDVVGTDFSKIPPRSDNILINGRNSFNCSQPSYDNSTEWLGSNLKSSINWTCVEDAPLSKFQFQTGKTHRLRLINHGADGVQKFSIDGHSFTVISIDYVPVVPYTTNTITLAVGQRTDVLVTANNNSAKSYYMRTTTTGGDACGQSSAKEALAVVYYSSADTTTFPAYTSPATPAKDCASDPLPSLVPSYPLKPSSNPYQQDLTLSLGRNSTGNFEWQINSQTYRANFNEPLLYDAAAGNTSNTFETQDKKNPLFNIFDFGSNSSVLLNVTNNTPVGHPFHLHGHNFYVLASGHGVWDGSLLGSANPTRRDTQWIDVGGYVVLQFEADNPGVWPFHCHVAWHLSGGLAINVATRTDEIVPIPKGTREQTCVDWDAYTKRDEVDQIDSGS